MPGNLQTASSRRCGVSKPHSNNISRMPTSGGEPFICQSRPNSVWSERLHALQCTAASGSRWHGFIQHVRQYLGTTVWVRSKRHVIRACRTLFPWVSYILSCRFIIRTFKFCLYKMLETPCVHVLSGLATC